MGLAAGESVLVQRHQLSGLCYMHGPDALQHYIVSMATRRCAGMIDITRLIRRSFSAEQLRTHVFEDKGGSSQAVLELILVSGSETYSTDIDMITRERLERFGPCLVSGFKVHRDFFQEYDSRTRAWTLQEYDDSQAIKPGRQIVAPPE